MSSRSGSFSFGPTLDRYSMMNSDPDPTSYRGWNHYFPPSSSSQIRMTPYVSRKIKQAIDYFDRNPRFPGQRQPASENGASRVDERAQVVLPSSNSSSLSYRDVIGDIVLNTAWPELVNELHETPEETLSIFSLAMYQVLTRDVGRADDDEVGDDDDGAAAPAACGGASLPRTKTRRHFPFVRARLTEYEKFTSISNLRANLFGKLVAVRGTVVRVGNTKPLCTVLAFRCRSCCGVTTEAQPNGKFLTPVRCRPTQPLDEQQHHVRFPLCHGNTFDPVPNSPLNVIIELQSVRLQEDSCLENAETSGIPKFVECELMEDLVFSCAPGQSVTVTGIVKGSKIETSKGKKENNMSSIYIEAVSVSHHIVGTDRCDESFKDKEVTFSDVDCEAIRNTFERPNLFAVLSASLCPSICGNLLVKAGLLLGLLGGNVSVKRGPHYANRCDVHVLVMGDPGLGKSQLLRACCRLSRRGVYVCGNASTNAGLTLTVTRDVDGKEQVLEAGALVLSDRGLCCIDEFDKMKKQHQSLLEVMEQQTVSLAKSGVVCSMPARTAVLAAANPSGGRYDRRKKLADNINIASALLSRFDLIFLLFDRADLQTDKLLTEHVMGIHSSSRNGGASEPNAMGQTGRSNHLDETSAGPSNPGFSRQRQRQRPTRTSARTDEDVDGERKEEGGDVGPLSSQSTLKERLASVNQRRQVLLSSSLLAKYISYAREYVFPLLDAGAVDEILQFYLELRETRFSDGRNTTPVTPRQLESLVRLSQARAKAELRQVVTRDDARDVIEIVKSSLSTGSSDRWEAKHQQPADGASVIDFKTWAERCRRTKASAKPSFAKERKRFCDILFRHSVDHQKSLYSLDDLERLASDSDIDALRARQIVEYLNDQGYLLKQGVSTYKINRP